MRSRSVSAVRSKQRTPKPKQQQRQTQPKDDGEDRDPKEEIIQTNTVCLKPSPKKPPATAAADQKTCKTNKKPIGMNPHRKVKVNNSKGSSGNVSSFFPFMVKSIFSTNIPCYSSYKLN